MPDTVTFTETITHTNRDVTEEERYLAHRYNQLIDRCITFAGQQMMYGTLPTKLTITKSVLASASRLAALDSKSQTDQIRVQLQSLLTDMTAVDASTFDAITEYTDDQDETG